MLLPAPVPTPTPLPDPRYPRPHKDCVGKRSRGARWARPEFTVIHTGVHPCVLPAGRGLGPSLGSLSVSLWTCSRLRLSAGLRG